MKNAKFLVSIGYISAEEPPDGYCSLVPDEVLARLQLIPPGEVNIERLADVLKKHRPPRAGNKVTTPLFSGTLRFVQTTFSTGGVNFVVPDADMGVAIEYAGLAAVPISDYASQYGANGLTVATNAMQFKASVPGGTYNDSSLSGWVDQLAKANGFGSDTCLVFLNPQGAVNSDADATQGVLGYHNLSSSGVPYCFVNVLGTGLTIDDRQDFYAVALSHEIAEMTGDPRADGSNPELCDPCAGNCRVDYRNYFDKNGKWLGGSSVPGYQFFIDGIATPAGVVQCPSPQTSCVYAPPRP